MTRQKKAKPASALAENRPRIREPNHPEHTNEADTAQPLIDKHGHAHSEAVLRHWSPAVLKAMGVRRIKLEQRAQRPARRAPICRRPELPRRRV